jgi:hypothetical protein
VVEANYRLVVTRSATVSTETDWLTTQPRRSALKAIGKVVRARETAENTSTEKPGLGLVGHGSTGVERYPARSSYRKRRWNKQAIPSRPEPSSRKLDGSGTAEGDVVPRGGRGLIETRLAKSDDIRCGLDCGQIDRARAQ